ncbi:MAG: methyltransferase domain-containing protein [Schleiferiaceae bacterium]|nr:methyltransferase domain-containing protein [Schleiferiaceae bacterium]
MLNKWRSPRPRGAPFLEKYRGLKQGLITLLKTNLKQTMAQDDLVTTTKNYYDSEDADNFYHAIWGGEDIHVGIYQKEGEDIATASHRSVAQMLQKIPEPTAHTEVLDMGAGYGGGARYLAKTYRCPVTCLNLSTTENERNRTKTREAGLDHLVKVDEGNFEQMPYQDESFDLVWCQDSILHSGNKEAVIKEVARVLKPGGDFIFTDPMQSDDCPDGVLDPILERIHLGELGSVKKYRTLAQAVGLTEESIEERPEMIGKHYGRVREELRQNKDKLQGQVSNGYIQRMDKGLGHWVEGSQNGYLNWGILHFKKP